MGPYRVRRWFYVTVGASMWQWWFSSGIAQIIYAAFLKKKMTWMQTEDTSDLAELALDMCRLGAAIWGFITWCMWHRVPKSHIWLCPLPPGSSRPPHPVSVLRR